MPETKRKFELKKYKKFMGMDCPGYNCDLWQDGKLLAHVLDDGSGGMTRFDYVDRKEGESFEAYCKTLPPLPARPELGYSEMKMDAELYMDELLNRHEIGKKVGKDCAKGICAKEPSDPQGVYHIFAMPMSPAGKEVVLKKYPKAVIINELYPDGNWFETVMAGDPPKPRGRR